MAYTSSVGPKIILPEDVGPYKGVLVETEKECKAMYRNLMTGEPLTPLTARMFFSPDSTTLEYPPKFKLSTTEYEYDIAQSTALNVAKSLGDG